MEKTPQAPRFDRRHDANFQRAITIGTLLVTLVVNVAAIAWGAAKLQTSVEYLQNVVNPLVIKVEQNTNDISVIKDRYNRSRKDASE